MVSARGRVLIAPVNARKLSDLTDEGWQEEA